MKIRTVAVSKIKHQGSSRTFVHDYDGLFHGWGVDYDDVDGGAGAFTIAIVEKLDGTVKLVPLVLLRFTSSPETR